MTLIEKTLIEALHEGEERTIPATLTIKKGLPHKYELDDEYYDLHPSSRKLREVLDHLWELHLEKSNGYGSADDPFQNIRNSSAELGLPGWIGVVMRERDKLTRKQSAARQYIEGGKVSLGCEPLLDAFYDQALYSAIGAVLLMEGEE